MYALSNNILSLNIMKLELKWFINYDIISVKYIYNVSLGSAQARTYAHTQRRIGSPILAKEIETIYVYVMLYNIYYFNCRLKNVLKIIYLYICNDVVLNLFHVNKYT